MFQRLSCSPKCPGKPPPAARPPIRTEAPVIHTQTPELDDPPALPAEATSSLSVGPRLELTDFLDLATLQEVQDAFASLTRLNTTILDAKRRPVTVPTDTLKREQSDQVFEQLLDLDVETRGDGRFAAPITVEGRTLGSIVIEPTEQAATVADRALKVEALADSLKLDAEQSEELLAAADQALGTNRAAAIQFLYLMANAITKLCYETYQSRQRLDELSVLYRISTALAGNRTLQEMLDTAAASGSRS